MLKNHVEMAGCQEVIAVEEFKVSPVDADKNTAFIKEEITAWNMLADLDDEDPFDAAFFDIATGSVGRGSGLIW